MVFLRLVSQKTKEYETLMILLPSSTNQKLSVITTFPGDSSKVEHTATFPAAGGGEELINLEKKKRKRQLDLFEAFRTVLTSSIAHLLNCPSIMDLLSIVGEKNAFSRTLGGELLLGCQAILPNFSRDVSNTFKESIQVSSD